VNPLTLPQIFSLGIAGQQQIAEAIQQQLKISNSENIVPSNILDPGKVASDEMTVDDKFIKFIESLKKQGYFEGVETESEEYKERYEKAKTKFYSKQNALTDKQKLELAESYKTQGNQKLSSKIYAEAIECYSKAIDLCSNNAIYYCNRAAAYSHLGEHNKAITDCEESIKLNPNYSKAYSRLGFALYSINKYSDAVQQYTKALELDPNNSSLLDSLKTAQIKLDEQANEGKQSKPFSFDNIPEILSDPQFKTMAEQLMSQPGVQNLFSDPSFTNTIQNIMQNVMQQRQDSPSEDLNKNQ